MIDTTRVQAVSGRFLFSRFRTLSAGSRLRRWQRVCRRTTLYVACGGINAVAVVDTATGKIRGLIPTAWYPNG